MRTALFYNSITPEVEAGSKGLRAQRAPALNPSLPAFVDKSLTQTYTPTSDMNRKIRGFVAATVWTTSRGCGVFRSY